MNGGRQQSMAGSSADALTLRLAAFFAARGYRSVEPAMLLPADVVLDHMGEDIRRRLLLTTAPDGQELCLRPDFTLPVALHHLDQGCAGQARYAYAGFAFRFPASTDPLRRSAEFRQVGIEDYGNPDTAAADAGALDAAVAAVNEAGLTAINITLGDIAIFVALVDALGLSDVWTARLKRLFWRRMATNDIIVALDSQPEPAAADCEAGLGQALSGMDPEAARAVIGEVMAIAGTGPAGGREPEEIAARFVEKASARREGGPGGEVARLIEAYLAIATPAAEAVAVLTRLAGDAGIDLAEPIAALEQRLKLIEGRGIDMSNAQFSSAFGRRIEYYTGHVFEVRARGDADLGPIASGGRYDQFLSVMGAANPIAAVGCSVYVDRLAAAVEGSQ